jgi:hypothetical protein
LSGKINFLRMNLLKTGVLLLLLSISYSVNAQEVNKKISISRDSIDNAYDASDWLIHKKGFLLMPTLITEPAVGYGAAAAAIFFHSSYTEKNGPPSMSGVLGGATQNGTWMGGVFHVGYWNQDRLRYTGVIARTYINIGFYGAGYLGILEDEPVNLNLDAWVLFQQLKARIKESDFFIGGKYLLLKTDNTFEIPVDIPDFNGTHFSSTLSEVSAILNYDTRNNVFSPSKGFFIQLSGTYSDTWLGSDALYGRLGIDAFGYFPASNKLNIGLRYGSNHSLGDMPFYARPIIQMRGVPLMKYQNKNVTLMETEVSWDLYKRWSLIGFTGIGNAYSSYSEFDKGKSVHTLGSGFRYLLARKFGLKMGVDIAASQDDFAFYIVFGSAWIR